MREHLRMEVSAAPRASPAFAGAVAGGVAALLAVVVIAAGWRGGDWPAHVFRVELVHRDGLEVWNNYWYGGHHTLGYGILFPLLGAFAGIRVVAVVSAAVAAVLVDAIVRHAVGRTVWSATLWFAAGTVTNVAIGRLPFALGLTVGLAALWCVQRSRLVAGGVLTVVTSAASPVVSVFLAIVYAAWFVVARGRDRRRATVLGVLAVAPVIVVALRYPQGGTFPFRFAALALTLVVCGLVGWLVVPRFRLVRAASAVYALACVGAFLVPSPLGANITRLGMYAAGPVLLACASRSLARAGALVLVACWQWSPALDAIVRAGHDPSTQAAFYRPLLTYLDSVRDRATRVEVVPTARHWEAAYVAPDVPLARGWERQLDMRFNEVFYGDEPIDADAYLDWLRTTGVEFVALADADVDPSGRAEAALLRGGLGYLEEVWSGEHWRVWEVRDPTGLVDGPAELVTLGTDTVVLDVTAPGDVVVRVRASAFWSTDPPVCVGETADGWVVLRDVTPGRVELVLDESAVVGDDAGCAPP